jgi:hypothetical protein
MEEKWREKIGGRNWVKRENHQAKPNCRRSCGCRVKIQPTCQSRHGFEYEFRNDRYNFGGKENGGKKLVGEMGRGKIIKPNQIAAAAAVAALKYNRPVKRHGFEF